MNIEKIAITRLLKIISVAFTLASAVLTSPLSLAQTHESLVEENTYINYNGINIFVPKKVPKEFRDVGYCVNSVETVFSENNFHQTRKKYSFNDSIAYKDSGPSGKFNINMLTGASLPPFDHISDGPNDAGSHIQGLTRINTLSEAWVVFTRIRGSLIDAGKKEAGKKGIGSGTGSHDPGEMFVVKLGAVPDDHQGGKFLKLKSNDNQFNDVDEYDGGRDGVPNMVRYIHRFEKSSHPGGIQAAGNIIAIPHGCDPVLNDCDRPFVEFWDFSNPIEPILLQELKLKHMRDNQQSGKVSFARDADGSYILIAERNKKIANVYRTLGFDDFSSETKWLKTIPNMHFPDSWSKGGNNPQNANLIRECGSNRLYLVGLRHTGPEALSWAQENDFRLFRIDGDLNVGAAKLTNIYNYEFGQSNEYCQVRGGASIYITPDKKPILYCSSGWAEPVKYPSQSFWEKVSKVVLRIGACGYSFCLSELTNLGQDITNSTIELLESIGDEARYLVIEGINKLGKLVKIDISGANSRVLYFSEITAVENSHLPTIHIDDIQPGD